MQGFLADADRPWRSSFPFVFPRRPPESRLTDRTASATWSLATVLALAWGAGAFGANYPWAYAPLLIAAAILGAMGVAFGHGRVPWAVVVGLGLVAIAGAVQLLPLAPDRLSRISPHAIEIHRQTNLLAALHPEASLPLSIAPERTRLGLAFLGAFGVLLVGTSRMLTRGSAQMIAGAVTMLGVTLAVVGIVQHATFNGKIYGFWDLRQGGAPFGPFVNRNHFAGWMLMGLPLAIGFFSSLVSRGMRHVKPGLRNRVLWLSSPDASRAILTGVAVLVMTLSLVLTMSRSGMTALAGAMLLAAVVMVRHQAGLEKRAVVSGYLAFVALVVVAWIGWERIAARFAEADTADLGGRPAIWADTLRIAQDFWLTGTGLNTYGVSTLLYQTVMPTKHLREAHNDYLQLAAEGGILLCLPVLVTIAAFTWTVRRRLLEDVGSIWWIRMGAVMGLLAIAAQSVGEFSLQMPGNAALLAVLCGVALHESHRV